MNKVVLITGASAGMGKATAKHLLEAGYTVYGAARRTEKMNDLKALGAHIVALDVTDDAAMVKAVDDIIKAEGRIDVLINNAGFGSYGTVEDVPMKDARYQLDVNLFGLVRMIQLALPHMRRQRSGKIVNVTSIGGKMAAPLGGWYHASKYAVEGLSDSLRLEVKPFGIDVILIEPGGVKTEWQDIAMQHMGNVSGNTAYAELMERAQRVSDKAAKNLVDPLVIAQLIKTSIEVKNPAARYAKGYMAGPVLFMKKWLSDGMFDKVLMSQLK